MIRKIGKWVLWAIAIGLVVFILYPPAKYVPYEVSPEYQAQIDEFHVPSMPDGWKFDKFLTDDFTKLRFGKGPINSDAKATLIVMPGFTGTLEQYAEHLTYWQANGYNVAGIDIRGQGGSERALKYNPEKPWVKDFSIYSKDIDGILKLHFKDSNTPLIFVAPSFGAHVAYRTVAAHETEIDGMVLFAPAFKPNTGEVPYSAAKVLYRLSKLFGKTDAYAPGVGNWKPDVQDLTQTIPCSAEPKRIYIRDAVFTKNPELRVGGATYRWFGELMLSGEKMITPEWTSKVDIPVMMLLADRDQIVINDQPKKVCDDLANCTLRIIEDSGHCIPQEVDRIVAQVYDSVDDLVEMALTNNSGQAAAP